VVWRYEIHGWRRCDGGSPGDGFVLRPGPATLGLRLRVTLWAALAIAAVGIGAKGALRLLAGAPSAAAAPAVDDRLSREIAELERNLSPAGKARVDQAEAARQARAQMRAARQRRLAALIRWAAGLLIAAAACVGIAAPLSALWNRLVVTSPEPGVLKLVETGWWRRSREIRLDRYGPPVLAQYELKTQGAGYFTWLPPTRSGAWVLLLSPADVAAPRVEFWLRALRRPSSQASLPEQELVQFVRPLEALIGLPAAVAIHPAHRRIAP